MKKLVTSIATAAALAVSFNANAKLDREEREEYMDCQKVAWVADRYDITWFDSTAWEETLALYHAEMSELEIRKLDKKVEREVAKISRKVDTAYEQLKDYVPLEHRPYIIYTALMMNDDGMAAFYECQL